MCRRRIAAANFRFGETFGAQPRMRTGGVSVGAVRTDFNAGAIAKPHAATPAESSRSVTGTNDIFLLSEADAKKSGKHSLQDAFGEVIKESQLEVVLRALTSHHTAMARNLFLSEGPAHLIGHRLDQIACQRAWIGADENLDGHAWE